MLDVAFVLLLTAWSALVGRSLLALCGAEPPHPVDRLGLAIPLGLGALAMASLLLGEVGRLDRAGFSAVVAAGLIFVAVHHVRRRARGPAAADRAPTRPETGPGPSGASWTDRLVDASFAATLLGIFLTSLSPVTDGDALCYHLQVPKTFLNARGMTFDPDLHETIYPLVTEMLYAAALAFRGPVACRLVQWVLGVCFAANAMALARPVLGPRSRWAGAVAMLVPAVSNGMGAPLNDVALAAYANAALVAVMLWRDRPSRGRAALAGVCAGLAIGVKYPALVWAGVLAIAMLAPRGRSRESRSEAIEDLDSRLPTLDSLLLFATSAALVGGWWYLRAFMHTGNPVYPFFRHAFGGAGIDDVLDPIKRPMAVTPWNLLTAIGPMTLDPDRFDSLSHQLGPAFLLLAPGLFLLGPPRRVAGLAGVGFAFLTLCLTQRQSMRFVLAAVGPFAVAAAWIASRWSDRGSVPGRAMAAVFAAILLFESTIALGRARHGLGVILGRESAEAFLDRREPTYRVGRWIGANLPASARLIGQEHRGFYLPRPYAMELAHRRRTGLAARGEAAGRIVATLRDEGFSHLLICPPEPISAVEFDPTLTRALSAWLDERTPIYREAIADPDGVTRRYAIYALDAPSSRSRFAMRAPRAPEGGHR